MLPDGSLGANRKLIGYKLKQWRKEYRSPMFTHYCIVKSGWIESIAK